MADDAILGVAVEWMGLDIPVKFGDSTLRSIRIIRIFALVQSFYELCALVYSI